MCNFKLLYLYVIKNNTLDLALNNVNVTCLIFKCRRLTTVIYIIIRIFKKDDYNFNN